EQATFIDCSPEQLELLRYLITFVDDRGYIAKLEEEQTNEEPGRERSRRRKFVSKPIELQELADSHEPPVGVAAIEDALQLLQKLDPPGVGARSLQECLLLQLTHDMPHYELVRTLVQNHLEDIEHNRMPVI